MKKRVLLMIAVIFCLSLAACGIAAETNPDPQETHREVPNTEAPEPTEQSDGFVQGEESEEPAMQSTELVGPWHLDSEKNDLAAFADSLDLFPGYGEWGAGMEIRSDGQMNWFIGAEGWHGTYTVEDRAICAQLTSDLDQTEQNWIFRMTGENGAAILKMDYQDMTIYWAYGGSEDDPAMGVPSKVYVDRQGTDEIYSSLSMSQSDNGYVIEMEIYRLGYFRGTAVEDDGMLVYTDDLVDMKGTIRYDSDYAVFEVTESTSDLAKAGTTWAFPELQEGF